MQQIARLGALSTALVLGLGCVAEEPSTTSTASAPLTINDVDFAPECGGIIYYTNWASVGELDSYLPNSLAQALVARRAVQPFVDLMDISSVSGVAQGRLAQIASRARRLDFIDVECDGVYEELAVSHDDRVAILAWMNAASREQLEAVAQTQQVTTADAILAARPYTTLQQVADTYNIGPDTFRAIRDAAVVDPFDELVGRVNAAGWDSEIWTAFDWYEIANDQPYHPAGMTCFGIDPDVVAYNGGVLRPNLADGAEVMTRVTSTVSFANRRGQVGDSSAGLAHLAAQVNGQTFKGCYISFNPDPWSGVNRAFFINTRTGYRVLTETRWSE